jgi:hypothetical protein
VVVRVLFDIGVVLLLGYVGWALLIHAFNRVLKRSQAEGPTTRAQRMATLLPLARKFLQVVLIVIIVMIVLSSLGINIGRFGRRRRRWPCGRAGLAADHRRHRRGRVLPVDDAGSGTMSRPATSAARSRTSRCAPQAG